MIRLSLAGPSDAAMILAMQKEAFWPLYKKYQDHGLSPALEKVWQIRSRMKAEGSRYYLIWSDDVAENAVGAIRVKKLEAERYRISPLFILPQYQGQGLGHEALAMAEAMYRLAVAWELETIREEIPNCSFYEAAGYEQTGTEVKVNERMTLIAYEKKIRPHDLPHINNKIKL